MKRATIVALVGLVLSGCAGTSGGGSVPEWQAKAGDLAFVVEPWIEYLERTGEDPETVAAVRAAVDGLRLASQVRGSLEDLDQLIPIVRDLMIARGDSVEDVERKVAVARSGIAAVRIALR